MFLQKFAQSSFQVAKQLKLSNQNQFQSINTNIQVFHIQLAKTEFGFSANFCKNLKTWMWKISGISENWEKFPLSSIEGIATFSKQHPILSILWFDLKAVIDMNCVFNHIANKQTEEKNRKNFIVWGIWELSAWVLQNGSSDGSLSGAQKAFKRKFINKNIHKRGCK